MCFMPVVGLQSLFSNLQYATSLLIHIIPITLGATGTYTYLKKREDAHAKAFKNLNKELEEMDISNEIEKISLPIFPVVKLGIGYQFNI